MPWAVLKMSACFIVKDRDGYSLAHVYYEDETGRQSAAKLLTREKADPALGEACCLRSQGIRPAFVSIRFQARESSDNPRVKAFCRVAPSLRFRLLAIFLAGVFLRAADFNSRTSAIVQGRRLEFLLAIYDSPIQKRVLITGSIRKRKRPTHECGGIEV